MPATVRKGSKGNDVIRLQRMLNAVVRPSPRLREDGDFGARTEAVVKQFQRSMNLDPDGVVGPMTWNALTRRYNGLSVPAAGSGAGSGSGRPGGSGSGGSGSGSGSGTSAGASANSGQGSAGQGSGQSAPSSGGGLLPTFSGGDRQATIDAIIAECRKQGVTIKAQIAYVLATAGHESGFQPVREAFYLGESNGRAERYRRTLRYYPYYGRGYVQLTWDYNYRKYGTMLGLNMVANPDLALQPNVALFVLVHGMKTGNFTGKKLSDYITATNTDFRNARRIINGMDKADKIAGEAQGYLARLG